MKPPESVDSETFESQPTRGRWQCCFCGETIEEEGSFSNIEIYIHDGGSQGLRAHAACLKTRLHPTVPVAF